MEELVTCLSAWLYEEVAGVRGQHQGGGVASLQCRHWKGDIYILEAATGTKQVDHTGSPLKQEFPHMFLI